MLVGWHLFLNQWETVIGVSTVSGGMGSGAEDTNMKLVTLRRISGSGGNSYLPTVPEKTTWKMEMGIWMMFQKEEPT